MEKRKNKKTPFSVVSSATPEERKQFWQEWRNENMGETVAILLITLGGILAIWLCFFR